VRRKALEEDFSHIFICMFARLIRSRLATQSPVKAVMFILLEDRMVPRRVAPLGIAAFKDK
jgi:hypothetical protein